MKARASGETVRAFLKAVYPEMTELAIASNSEETCLQDATRLIADLQAQLAASMKTPPVGVPCKARLSVEPVDCEWPHCDCDPHAEKVVGALIEEGWAPRAPGPTRVCLCGSTRFTGEMLVTQWLLTKKGKIVLSWCALPDEYFEDGQERTHIGDQEGVKEAIDELHKRKIDLADEVFVLNVGGYIGESTRSEIEYAVAHGKPVSYLESDRCR